MSSGPLSAQVVFWLPFWLKSAMPTCLTRNHSSMGSWEGVGCAHSPCLPHPLTLSPSVSQLSPLTPQEGHSP